MHAEILQRTTDLADLCRFFGVLRLAVFGSAARAIDFDPATSDADFLVEFESNFDGSDLGQFFGFAEALERLLGRPIDLIESGAVINPFVRAEIDSTRETVYAA